jgi:hypothetical protein
VTLPIVRSMLYTRRTVVIVIDKSANTETDVGALQKQCAADPGVKQVKLESDRIQWQLNLRVRSKDVYNRLRADLKPAMGHNVIVVHAVVEGDPEDGNTLLGFVFLDESSRGAEEFEQAFRELYHSLGSHQVLRTGDKALAAVVLRDEPTNFYSTVVSALSSHSIEVVKHEFLSPAKTISQILSVLRRQRNMAVR